MSSIYLAVKSQKFCNVDNKFVFNSEIHPGSTSHILQMLHPLLERQNNIASEFGHLQALHELRQAGVALPEKYQGILDRESELQTSMKKQPAHIKRLKCKKQILKLSKNPAIIKISQNPEQLWCATCSWTLGNSRVAAPERDCPSCPSCWTTTRTFRPFWNFSSGRKLKSRVILKHTFYWLELITY